MSTIEDGGSAFPAGSVRKSRPAHDPGGNWVETDRVQPLHQGLTMRDYFAAKAMAGMVSSIPFLEKSEYACPKIIADAAYRVADAMLAARKEKP